MNLPNGSLRWIRWLLILALALATLYVVTLIHAAGEVLLASAVLCLAGLGAWVYSSQRLYTYRYLFPGIAAVVVFVVFPIVYTVAIGFTNYSSKNLLSFQRATEYFLDETYQADSKSFAFELVRDGARYRAHLREPQSEIVFSTPSLDLESAVAQEVRAEPKDGADGDLVSLKDLIALRPALQLLTIVMPDGSPLRMTGLREFGPVRKLFARGDGDALVNQQSGEELRPNFSTGFYERPNGESVAPGFQVNIGAAHFQRIFTDEAFRQPFFKIFAWTVAFSALTVFFAASLGMLLAVLLSWDALRFRGVYQLLLFLPYAVPGFISILVFKGLFNNNFGEINLILSTLFGIKPAWFSDPMLAKVMILIVNTWLGYPYMMVMCSGLIKSIPADLYEASAVAGAGPLTNFFRITLPLVLKPLTPLLIAVFAFNFNNFVLINLLTNGRPDFLDTSIPAGTTDILVSYTYRIAFEDSGQNFGLAAAISTVIFAMVALLSWINFLATRMTKERNR